MAPRQTLARDEGTEPAFRRYGKMPIYAVRVNTRIAQRFQTVAPFDSIGVMGLTRRMKKNSPNAILGFDGWIETI